MSNSDWRVEAYRGMDVYVLVSQQRTDGVASVGGLGEWRYEVRVAQEGADPSDAGDTERSSGDGVPFASRRAAEEAAFAAGYQIVDKLVGRAEG
ncbi:hypothetical protein AB4Z48_03240 [Cupriavidus sp. 2TAF22]|uniref:hypothetical protein n=1 Tax=unclassified Cupriavidus TaxID=2640874 RepID=UPI003F924F5D